MTAQIRHALAAHDVYIAISELGQFNAYPITAKLLGIWCARQEKYSNDFNRHFLDLAENVIRKGGALSAEEAFPMTREVAYIERRLAEAFGEKSREMLSRALSETKTARWAALGQPEAAAYEAPTLGLTEEKVKAELLRVLDCIDVGTDPYPAKETNQ